MIVRKKDFLNNPVKSGQKSRIVAEIYVDNMTELPQPNSIEGCELVQSSIVYVISSGEIYVLGGDGKWYSSEGEQA